MKSVWKALICGAALVIAVPTLAFAQASITGTVRDPSGAVLPGVTIDASSSALIEKMRTAVTDGSGQYRITDLPSGTYRVSFTLPGFATVQRDGIELSGSFTATVNVEMRVGGVEETITITGEAPIVDVQSTVRQDVLKGSLITELPAARNIQNIAILIPGMTVTGTLDVGGLRGGAEVNNFSAHGGRIDDGRLLARRHERGRTDRRRGRQLGRRRHQLLPARHGQRRGAGGHDVGRARRSRVRRPGDQRRPEVGRQHAVGRRSSSTTRTAASRAATSPTSCARSRARRRPATRGPHHHARPDRRRSAGRSSATSCGTSSSGRTKLHREEGADHVLQPERRHQRAGCTRPTATRQAFNDSRTQRRQRPPDVAGDAASAS